MPVSCCQRLSFLLQIAGMMPKGRFPFFAACIIAANLQIARAADADKTDKAKVAEVRTMATGGDALAQLDLGFMYESGRVVPQDDVEAVAWYRKAAGQGFANAQHSLGVCYTNGEGVPQDEVEAYKWFPLASAKGVESSKVAREQVEERLNPEQRAKGKRLAREFRPKVNL